MTTSNYKRYQIDIEVRKYDIDTYDEQTGEMFPKPKVKLSETKKKLSLDLEDAIRELVKLL